MELYTLVSLIIGIFGSTYAALNALRTNLESDLRDAFKSAGDKLDAVIRIRGDLNAATAHCRKHRQKICSSWSWWLAAQLTPAVLFYVAILFLSFWVVWDWHNVAMQHTDPTHLTTLHAAAPWCWFRGILGTLAVLNVFCVVAAFLAWMSCKGANSRLQEHYESLEKPPAGLENPSPA